MDNALDACEEAGILPEVEVRIQRVAGGEPAEESAPAVEVAARRTTPTTAERFRVTVRDNGPGIVRDQIPKIFGKLLYGSKFHRLRQSLTADEPIVIRRRGRIERTTIGSLCDELLLPGEEIRDVSNLGIEVPAFDSDSLRYAWRPVSHVIRHRRENEIYRVRTEMGCEIKVTGCHSLFSWDPGEGTPVPVEARTLRPGDYLLAPRRLPVPSIRRSLHILEWTDESAWMGRSAFVYGIPRVVERLARRAEVVHYRPTWSRTPRRFLRFRTPDGRILDVFDETFRRFRRKGYLPVALVLSLGLAKECRGGTIRTYRHGRRREIPASWRLTPSLGWMLGVFAAEGHADRRQIGFTFGAGERALARRVEAVARSLGFSARRDRRDPNAIRVKVFGNGVEILFSAWCGRGAKNKRVPPFVFDAPFSVRQAFLDGLHAGDGHRFRKKRELVLTTASETLAEETVLLWRLQGGIALLHRPAVRKGMGRNPSRTFRVSVFGEDVPKSSVFSFERGRRALRHRMVAVEAFSFASGYLVTRRRRFSTVPDAVMAIAGLDATGRAAAKSRGILQGIEPGRIYDDAEIRRLSGMRCTAHTTERWVEMGFLRKTKNGFEPSDRIGAIRRAIHRLQVLSSSDLCLLRIVEVERIENGHPFVYDLSVPGAENFVGGKGLLACHNSRGQQGIGISAAAMYGQMTTGAATRIVSRTGPKKKAHRFVIRIDTKANDAKVIKEESFDWDHERGTEVEIDLEGIYQRGARSVEAYLEGTVIANPHVTLVYRDPDGNRIRYPRAAEALPGEPAEIKPHPYGVELGTLMDMLHTTRARNVASFLQSDFSRVGPTVAREILAKAGIPPNRKPSAVTPKEAEALYRAIGRTKIMAPPTNCLVPIGEELLLKGLSRLVKADFTTAVTRKPSVYRGNPFLVEAAIAYGGELPAEEPATLFRFANRVPLLYQQGACAITKAVIGTNWRAYGLAQPKGALPVGPLVVLVHIASVWVPFTSEAKEAIASYPEILKEIRLALQECGRRLGTTIRRRAREAEAARKKDYIKTYLPQLVVALGEILDHSDRERKKTEKALLDLLERKTARAGAAA